MSSEEFVISLSDVTKSYRVFSHPGDRLKQFLSAGLMRFHRDFLAIKGVSFKLKRGETVGIVGRNGSGKSTLLQLICGILRPDKGTINVDGRISALLELGSGFNPEFTGRENVYFQGSIMGLTRSQMDDRFDAIASFADIGEFIDQPVRMYSSGMFVRLAFSVGIHVSPDILVVDEALAVGDEAFQRKCFLKIQAIRERGGNVLFVSHNMNMIATHCDSVILLDKGRLLMHEQTGPVISKYRQLLLVGNASKGTRRLKNEEIPEIGEGPADQQTSSATSSCMRVEEPGAVLDSLHFVQKDGRTGAALIHSQTYLLEYRTTFVLDATDLSISAYVKLKNGFVLGMFAAPCRSIPEQVKKGQTICFALPFNCVLLPGTYMLDCEIVGEMKGRRSALNQVFDKAFSVLPQEGLPGLGAVNFSAAIAEDRA